MAAHSGNAPAVTDAVLRDGGEMGALMRSLDWSRTPLGPIVAWPQSLRTAVSICLASRFPMLIWWGPELVMLYNDDYYPLIGAKHPQAMGQRGRDCFPEVWDVIGPMLAGVIERGEATWSEDQLLLLNRKGYAEECYFTFSYSPIRDESGGIGGIFTAVTETTERVLGERRLGTLKALADAATAVHAEDEVCQHAMRALAENSGDLPFAALYLLDEAGTQARLCGTTRLNADTPASPAVVSLDGKQADTAPWSLGTVARTGQPAVISDLTEHFGPLPGGIWDVPPHTALALPLLAPAQDRPIGVLVVGVSPRRALDDSYRGFFSLVAGQIATAIGDARAYEAERQRAESLAALDRAKTAFFSNVSHEFRTPLTLLLGPLAEVLADEAAIAEPERREQLAIAHRNGLRLLKLVNTLLDFSRIEAGRMRATYEPTDLAALTRDLAGMFRAAIEAAGLRFIVDCPPLDEPVYVDREMWEKIVLNLLSNAFKFTLSGEIAVKLHATDGRVTLTVRDTGTGIPAEELPHIFERFRRVENARGRSVEGSGIGLALVQELVHLHGGAINVTSAVDGGTTFTVTVPRGTAHLPPEHIGGARARDSTALGAMPYVEEALRWVRGEDESPPLAEDAMRWADRAPESAGTPLDTAARPRIVLADDNADMRAYVAHLLGSQYRIETVGDGNTALAAIRERPPDLVLTDVMMPGIDGFALLRALRADPSTRAIPVVLVSAHAGEEARVTALEAGANDYLVKPFSARELVARVGAQLQIARIRAEAEAAIREQAEQLRESEQRLQLGLHIGRMVAWEWDPHANVITTSDNFTEIYGVTPITIAEEGFALVHPDDKARHETIIQHAVETAGDYHSEFRIIRPDTGAVVWLEERGVAIVDEAGTLRKVIGVAVDITGRKASDEEQRRFLAMVAHELRNPLTSLTGYAELLRRRERYEARSVEAIITQAKRLERLTRDLRETAHATTGTLAIRRAPVDVRALIAETVEQAQASTAAHTITVTLPDAIPAALWDADRIGQALGNLLLNAIKYSPDGGDIAVRADDLGGGIRIAVTDNGIGIPAEAQAAIFEPFYRAGNVTGGQARGMGLGLPICKALVEAHGGTIAVRSATGSGSTFTITLPYVAPAS